MYCQRKILIKVDIFYLIFNVENRQAYQTLTNVPVAFRSGDRAALSNSINGAQAYYAQKIQHFTNNGPRHVRKFKLQDVQWPCLHQRHLLSRLMTSTVYLDWCIQQRGRGRHCSSSHWWGTDCDCSKSEENPNEGEPMQSWRYLTLPAVCWGSVSNSSLVSSQTSSTSPCEDAGCSSHMRQIDHHHLGVEAFSSSVPGPSAVLAKH